MEVSIYVIFTVFVLGLVLEKMVQVIRINMINEQIMNMCYALDYKEVTEESLEHISKIIERYFETTKEKGYIKNLKFSYIDDNHVGVSYDTPRLIGKMEYCVHYNISYSA